MALSIQSGDMKSSDDGPENSGDAQEHTSHYFSKRYELNEDPLVPSSSLFQMSLRHDVQTMEDARAVGLSLIDGRTQILNLEQVAPDLAARIIDFLDGVAFALEGSVECISGAIYLVTPGGVVIQK